jgi:hypothetical protein
MNIARHICFVFAKCQSQTKLTALEYFIFNSGESNITLKITIFTIWTAMGHKKTKKKLNENVMGRTRFYDILIVEKCDNKMGTIQD